MKIRTKAPNFALTKELNENTNKRTNFWLKVWQDWTLFQNIGRNYFIFTGTIAKRNQIIYGIK